MKNPEHLFAQSLSVEPQSVVTSKMLEIPRQEISIIRQLGVGHAGTVSKALLNNRMFKSGLAVAVKSVIETSTSQTDRVHMLQEAAVMSGLSHDNVVKLIGVVTVGDPVMIVIEFCDRGSLKEYFQTATPPDEVLSAFTMDCALGMEYLASRNIVHRDLAARNVLVDSNIRCKISDYGMSRVLDDKTFYRSYGATLPVRWTAPEALEEQIFTKQSDVWSYGVLLVEIWTNGALPYDGMNERKVWVEVAGGYRMPVPARCPALVGDVMSRCWRESGDRPEFAEIISALKHKQQVTNILLATSIGPASGSTDVSTPKLSQSNQMTHITDV